MKPRDLLALFGAFWVVMIVAGALGITDFRVYAGNDFKTFCKEHP